MSFNSLLINTVTIRLETKDKWGKIASTVDHAAIPCRIVYKNRIVRNSLGQEVLSSATVYFKTSAPIEEGALIFFEGRWHGIQAITRAQNAHALHHFEVAVD